MPHKTIPPTDADEGDVVLGNLGLGDEGFDTSLQPTTSAAPLSHRKAEPAASDEPPPPAEEAPLALPSTALAVLRSSGGLRFSSREVVVFRDGRVSARDIAPLLWPRRRSMRILSAAEMEQLRRLIMAARLDEVVTPRRASPDAFVDEVVTRWWGREWRAELYAGLMTEAQAALVAFLRDLIPEG